MDKSMLFYLKEEEDLIQKIHSTELEIAEYTGRTDLSIAEAGILRECEQSLPRLRGELHEARKKIVVRFRAYAAQV